MIALCRNILAEMNLLYLMVGKYNGEEKKFDVKPYIKGEWYGNLKDVAYFKSVSVDGYTIVWPDGQDICPDELYELSYA